MQNSVRFQANDDIAFFIGFLENLVFYTTNNLVGYGI